MLMAWVVWKQERLKCVQGRWENDPLLLKLAKTLLVLNYKPRLDYQIQQSWVAVCSGHQQCPQTPQQTCCPFLGPLPQLPVLGFLKMSTCLPLDDYTRTTTPERQKCTKTAVSLSCSSRAALSRDGVEPPGQCKSPVPLGVVKIRS